MQGFLMFRPYRVFTLLRPQRPRHPFVQALLAVFAICAFLVLMAIGLAVAAFVMVAGAVMRAFAPTRPVQPASGPQAKKPEPAGSRGDVIDGEFSVVDKTLPHGSGR